MIKNNFVIVLLVVLICGCTTIHFDNGSDMGKNITKEKWHHNTALNLYELSDPINLKEECGSDKWVSVQTELSLENGVASNFVNSILPVWYPKTVKISCSGEI